MNPNQEITIYLTKCLQKLSALDNQHDEVCREVNELSIEDAHLAEYSKKLDSRIDTCKHVLAEHSKYLQSRTSREITIDLREFQREKSDVHKRCCEIHDEIEELDCKAVNLLDQSNELGAMIELCQRSLEGEDVSIWAEIQRCEFKQRG